MIERIGLLFAMELNNPKKTKKKNPPPKEVDVTPPSIIAPLISYNEASLVLNALAKITLNTSIELFQSKVASFSFTIKIASSTGFKISSGNVA